MFLFHKTNEQNCGNEQTKTEKRSIFFRGTWMKKVATK